MKPFPILRHLLTALLLLPLLCACFSEDYSDCEDKPTQMATANHYINLSIVVSSGSESATRAPLGGEDGDGREAGFARENEIDGITLVLYEVTKKGNTNTYTGINDITNEDIAFIKYYPVTLIEGSLVNQGTSAPAPSEMIEAKYTTGNQSLEGSQLNLNNKYRALVVANLDMTKEGFSLDSKVADVLEHTSKLIYNGSSIGATAKEFVMSLESEENTLITFDTPQTTTNANGQVIRIFEFGNIRIERLAARVDFWTKGAEEYREAEAEQGERSGYVYPVYKKDSDTKLIGDKFVLTAITPFNLYDSEEYLFKRIGTSNKDFKYLASENDMAEDAVVLDPYTLDKTTPPSTQEPPLTPSYTSPLSEIVENTTEGMLMSAFQKPNGAYKDALTTHAESSDQADNLIICYPKENTLPKDAPLYYYATGLRIEGDYYKDGTEEPTHLVYYGFLRHVGEGIGSSYPIYTKDDLEAKKDGDKLKNTFPMNFGVVRNNIYRISIDKITERETEQKDPEITWRIMVKNWDMFKHKTIFM